LKFGDQERVLPLHIKGVNSMTENDSVHKTDGTTPVEARRAFLKALYAGAPDDLYLELRCIHPQTGEVKTMWSQIGDKRTLTTAFRRADELNHDGYGIYFAPCLRSDKKGTAEAAALLPALWVDLDCDGDTARRADALERLHTFNPPPSGIIDSGGGLHAYWLLSEPITLDESSRNQAAGILRGLFSALGGDPQYVKSAASVMRLPGSVNTKPERRGVTVTLVELHPDRRYPLSDFAWLESQPQLERIGSLSVVTLNGNGHHPLPRRTEDYLAAGATEGSRNTELFQAACQLRDAGHSQADAEAQLAPRYVADGCSEREAVATIKSAYSRPPRDPVPQPREAVRERIDQLVSQYGRSEEVKERPTAGQIREAVTACAALDPLEWAEERKRLKAICGDTFKIDDLNQMYRQARRAQERADIPQLVSSPRYVEMDGAIVLERPTERGMVRQQVTDWMGRIIEWRVRVDDDGQSENLMRVALQHRAHTATLDVPSELFGDPNALQRFIAQKAGGIYAVCAGMTKHLPPAINRLSAEYPTHTTYGFMGWTQIDGHWVYVSPNGSVGAEGILETSPQVELESRLRDYGLKANEWSDSVDAFKAAVSVLPPTLVPALIAFTFLPLLQRFFPAAAPKPALHLVGTSGSGKSEIASILSSFYGEFTRDAPPAQWGDTVNTVETLGYALADALYWVDDYKPAYAEEKTFPRFLQSYSRGMGRGRLTREAKLRQERPCRGHLLSTGETVLEGEASVLARMIVLDIPPWEKRDPGGKALGESERQRAKLSAFTARFIQWIATQQDAGSLCAELSSRFAQNVTGYQQKLTAKLGRQANTGRMIQNWALLVTVYQMLMQFLDEMEVDATLPSWQDTIIESVKAVQEERAGQVFLDALGQLLASGRAMLATDLRQPEEPGPGTTVIGYRMGDEILLLPDVTIQMVTQTVKLNFDTRAIGQQLREDGWLVAGANSLTVQRRVRSVATRFWLLKPAALGCDDCDAVTDAG
jgi:Domain of unknown function (DUF927)